MYEAALEDVTVLDLGRYVSGPYCAKLFADYGATVIKVEPPGGGDPARRLGPFPNGIPHREKSGLFLLLNMNKMGVTLDITTEDGAKLFKELVEQADILIENFQPGYLSSRRLGPDELEEVNPRLVTTSITPFGSTGPYRGYKAVELGVFAMSGRMYPHGLEDREPLRYAPDTSWFQAGATAAVPTMGALFTARATGLGQHVDVSALEAHIGNVDNRPLHYAYTGQEVSRGYWLGGFPLGAYPCQDGYVVFGVVYERFFQRLCRVMGRPDILEDPRFAPSSRAQHREDLELALLEWTMKHTKRELFEMCQRERVLCGPLYEPQELLHDPQLKERGFFQQAGHPEAGALAYPGAPFIMSETPWRFRRPAPTLGQHNLDVYAGLGYSKEDLVRLRSSGVV